MKEIQSHLKMFAKLNLHHIKIGSERVDNTNQRRVVIIRSGKRVYGTKSYANMEDLSTAWIQALKYEYNKLK